MFVANGLQTLAYDKKNIIFLKVTLFTLIGFVQATRITDFLMTYDEVAP